MSCVATAPNAVAASAASDALHIGSSGAARRSNANSAKPGISENPRILYPQGQLTGKAMTRAIGLPPAIRNVPSSAAHDTDRDKRHHPLSLRPFRTGDAENKCRDRCEDRRQQRDQQPGDIRRLTKRIGEYRAADRA